MNVHFSKPFIKSYKKLDTKIKNAFQLKLTLFLKNEYDPILYNHALQGKYDGVRSINVTGDFRAHYTVIDNAHRHFLAIGTHSELYDR